MHPPSADVSILPVESFDLASRILKLLNWDESQLETRDMERHQGPGRKVLTWQIMVGLIAHALPFAGRFSQCLRHFFGMTLSDSALSQRRAQLGADLFLLIMRETLRPLADAHLHPGCFSAGLRLLGIDGTRWSVGNTPQHLARIIKAKTRRGGAAFATISMSALVELGTHAPLHATLGLDGQSEQVLSVPLFEELPPQSLLILDRLYGQAPMLEELQTHCAAARQQHYLVRVRTKLAVQVRTLLADGSALVEVALRDKIKQRLVLKTLLVREVRLWTSLSGAQASAEQLIELYARRWEQEVFYRELKLQVARGELLQSHTPETAQQEIAAYALPPRRTRSCERKVRQPVTKWPRMISPTSVNASAVYKVTKIA
jgi:hypothetical protein